MLFLRGDIQHVVRVVEKAVLAIKRPLHQRRQCVTVGHPPVGDQPGVLAGTGDQVALQTVVAVTLLPSAPTLRMALICASTPEAKSCKE